MTPSVLLGRRRLLTLGGVGLAGGAIALSRRTSPSTIETATGTPGDPVTEADDLPLLDGGGAPSVAGGGGWSRHGRMRRPAFCPVTRASESCLAGQNDLRECD